MGGLPCRAVLLLTLWPAAVSGTSYVASLQSNFVVNLDFEGQAKSVAAADTAALPTDDNESRVVAFAGGQQKFRCRLPSLRNTTTGAFSGDIKDHSKLEKYFRSAKLAPLKGRCFTFRKDYWSYDLCVGRKIVQYSEDGGLKNVLGEHSPEDERLYADGSITQLYSGGTENRTTIVRYVCGPGSSNLKGLAIHEERPLLYTVTVPAPQFCSWRERNGTMSTMPDGKALGVSSLLEDLRGKCINTTQGWWTYEYCFPHTLRQYHLHQGKKDPIHTLGTLNGTREILEPNEVNMSLEKLKPSVAAPRERQGVPSNHKVLQQYLGHGAVCDETGRARQVHMFFQCPTNWQQNKIPRFVSIGEASLCEYEVLIHTHLTCGHQRMLPALPRGQDVIQCSVESDA